MTHVKNLVGFSYESDGNEFALHDPFTGDLLALVENAHPNIVTRALECARSAKEITKKSASNERSDSLRRTAATLRLKRTQLARLITEDVGKPIRESQVEVDRAIEVLDLTASAVLRQHGLVNDLSSAQGGSGRLGYEFQVPAGVVVAIAPFNAPLNLAISKAAAALGAGCSVIIKSPPQAPRAITEAARLVASLWPTGALQVLHGGAEVGQQLVASPIPRVVTFTGSVGAGLNISRNAGIKRLILELGSNAPTIVCEDADIEEAARLLLRGAYGSAGQACISTQRILVHENIIEQFRKVYIPLVEALKCGDPRLEDTDVGPVIDDDAVARIRLQVIDAIDRGAEMLVGSVPELGKRLLKPILLERVSEGARLRTEEVFGPVALIIPFSTDEEAQAIANATEFGLQAGVFTKCIDRAYEYVDNLEFGGVQINETSRVRMDLHSFGGLKNSGIGREGVEHALDSMNETRFVGIRRKVYTKERF